LKKSSKIDRLIFAGIIGLLIFAPLAFGAVHVWAYTMVELGVFFLLLLWFLDRLFFSGGESLTWVRTPLNIFMVLLVVFIALQLMPLPLEWTAYFSPKACADKLKLYELTRQAGGEGGRGLSSAYYGHPLVMNGLKILTYLGMFFLVLHTARSKKRLNILIYTLICIGVFEVLYGTYQVFSTTPRVWWWGKSFYLQAGRASGTYIGANTFAGYLEMIIPLVFGFIIAQRRRQRRLVSGLDGARSRIQRFVGLLAPESANARMIFLFCAGIVLALGLLLSGSRGGILSLGAAMLGVSIIFFFKRGYRKYSALTIVFCLLAFSYGLHTGIEKTLARFGDVLSLEQRLYTTQTVFPMVADYPLVGVGLGNFKYVYPRYVTENNLAAVGGHAHNDWVEAFAELGVVGGGLVFAALLVYLLKMVRVWRGRRDLYALGIGTGAMAGLLSLAFHSYFDFNMHIPANPLTLAAVLAVGYAALHLQGRGFKESFFYRLREIRLTLARRVLIFLPALLALSGGMYAVGSHFMAEASCPTEWNSTLNLNWNPDYPEIRRAIELNPYNAEYRYKLAGFYYRMAGSYTRAGIAEPGILKEFNEWAIAGLEKAVRLNPADGRYWFELGKRYSFRSYDPYGYVNQWLPLAEACFEQAVQCAPKDPVLLFNVAWYWVWRSGLFAYTGGGGSIEAESGLSPGRDGFQNFQELFQRSLALDRRRWKQAVQRVWEYYPDDAVVLGIIPEGDLKLKNEALRMIIKEKG